ncbi:SH3 domain-containing protein [Ekhidna sp.]
MKNLSPLVLVFFLIACGGQNEQSSEAENPEKITQEAQVVEEKPAVCIWDKVSVRDTPAATGKWRTSISIGETLTYLGEDAIDSLDKNRKYSKVKLADGTEGWSASDFIIVDGRVAVFLNEKDIYKRPDLLTKSDKKFSQMDIVAIKSEQDDWVEITGKRSEGKWIESGWVKKGDLSTETIDVAVAKFASEAMAKEDVSEQIDGLNELLNNSDFAGSSFIPVVRGTVEELIGPAEIVVEEIVESDSLSENQ